KSPSPKTPETKNRAILLFSFFFRWSMVSLYTPLSGVGTVRGCLAVIGQMLCRTVELFSYMH
ncbi:MAG: hypothetical protein SOV46_03035, partial [Candidatus Faecousia sp.]|nr:hypothetical protein [Candidatus Faecousia sp.]